MILDFISEMYEAVENKSHLFDSTDDKVQEYNDKLDKMIQALLVAPESTHVYQLATMYCIIAEETMDELGKDLNLSFPKSYESIKYWDNRD